LKSIIRVRLRNDCQYLLNSHLSRFALGLSRNIEIHISFEIVPIMDKSYESIRTSFELVGSFSLEND
jgi:hypothetical protein